MSLATKLVSLRKEKGLTQIALAEKLDVSRQAISRWEVGTSVPSTDNLKVLCELYGVSVDYLLNDKIDHVNSHSNDQGMDTQDKDDQDPEISRQISKDVYRLHRIIYFGAALILVLLAVIISMVISPGQEEEMITPIPIGDLAVAEDNDYPTSTFSIDWSD